MPLDLERVEGRLSNDGSERGLSSRWYTDAWAEERDAVFHRTWACLGHQAEIADPGDVIPKDLMGSPLLMVRDRRDKTVRVFQNVCRHRGRKLVDAPQSNRVVITCPYHAWAYDLTGRLRTTPHIGGEGVHSVDGFDPADWGLVPVRCAVWFGLVFVNIDGEAPPFEDFVRPLADRWAVWQLDRFHVGGSDCRWSLDVAANWKLAVENYCEAYHLPMVHPGLNQYSRLDDHYNIGILSDAPRASFAGQGTRVYAPQRTADQTLPGLPDLPPSLAKTGEYVALFPNLLLGVHIDQAFAIVLEPLAPDRTREHLFLAYVDNAATDPGLTAARTANLAAWQEVFEEDVASVEGMQHGRHAPGFDGGIFTPVMDGPTYVFHRWAKGLLGD